MHGYNRKVLSKFHVVDHSANWVTTNYASSIFLSFVRLKFMPHSYASSYISVCIVPLVYLFEAYNSDFDREKLCDQLWERVRVSTQKNVKCEILNASQITDTSII